MATEMVLKDDLDGGEAVGTVEFGLDGNFYEIDLSDDNTEKLRKVLAKYVDKARPVKAKVTKVRSRTRTSTVSSNGTGSGTPSEAATIREWAKANDYEVSDRGRISAEVRDAYVAASK